MRTVAIEHTCQVCGIIFTTKCYQQERCSKSCKLSFRRSMRNLVYKECRVCLKKFKVTGNNLACSKECRDIGHDIKKEKLKKQTIKQCVVCGKNFIAIGRNLTCSKICSKNSINNRVNARYNIDVDFKLADVLRSRLKHAIKNNQKAGSAVRDLGCSIKGFKVYLEAKFQSGMTWNNWSLRGWHIDHIRPLSNFDLTNREELLIACHYSNLQPLWWRDNISKGKKYDQ